MTSLQKKDEGRCTTCGAFAFLLNFTPREVRRNPGGNGHAPPIGVASGRGRFRAAPSAMERAGALCRRPRSRSIASERGRGGAESSSTGRPLAQKHHVLVEDDVENRSRRPYVARRVDRVVGAGEFARRKQGHLVVGLCPRAASRGSEAGGRGRPAIPERASSGRWPGERAGPAPARGPPPVRRRQLAALKATRTG